MYSKIGRYSIYAVHLAFKVIGLAPSCVNILPSNRIGENNIFNVKFSHSRAGIIYNIVLLFYFALSIYMLHNFLFGNHDWPGKDDIIWKSLNFAKYLVCIFVISTITLDHECIMSVCNELFRLEAELDENLANFEHENKKKWRLIIPFFIDIVANCFCSIFTQATLLKGDRMDIFLVSIPRFVLHSFIIQYALLISLIRKTQSSLNHSFDILTNSELESRHNSMIIANAQREERLINNIILIAKAQRTISECCRRLGNFNSMLILLVIAYFSGLLIHSTHRIVSTIVLSSGTSTKFIVIFSLAIRAFSIVILCLNITDLIRAKKKTSMFVNRLMCIHQPHTRVQYELEQFCLELFHQKVSFSAGGLFSLDNTFLVSLLSTTITYSLILAQQGHFLSINQPDNLNETIEFTNTSSFT